MRYDGLMIDVSGYHMGLNNQQEVGKKVFLIQENVFLVHTESDNSQLTSKPIY
jgi:hypothetical protein